MIVGHDWGALVAWHAALLRPDRFRAVIGLSVPFRPRGPVRPTTAMPQNEESQFYQLYYQMPGVAEAELERDVRDTFLRVLYSSSEDAPRIEQASTTDNRTNSLMVPRNDSYVSRKPKPTSLQPWLTEADIDFFITSAPIT